MKRVAAAYVDVLSFYAKQDAISILESEPIEFWRGSYPAMPESSWKTRANRAELDKWLDRRANDNEWAVYLQALNKYNKAWLSALVSARPGACKQDLLERAYAAVGAVVC